MRERSRSPEHDRRSVQDAAEPAAPALDRAGIGNRAIGGLFGHELAFESDNALRALADSGPPPLGNHSMGRLVQAKLAIGRPDDPAEREADQVAQRAVRTPAELGPPAVRPTSSASGAGLAVAPDDVERAVAGGGHPLDAGTRSTMEQRLGADFSGVRVHPNSPAPQRLGAVAFTAGTDIVFAPSAYDAASPDGQRLLAHELAHVIQQGTGAAGSIQRQPAEAAQGAAPASGAAPNAEQVRIMAYQATVLQRVPPISESDQRALATVMSDMPVYQQLTERDRLRGELEQLQGWITDLEHRNAALARGEELSGGTGASPDEMAGYRARAAQLTARIDELTAQIAPQLAALGTDEAHLRQRVEQEFPEIWKRRAESIVLSMLAENEAAARREQARYGGNMSSIDIDGLLRADAFLKGLADEIKTVEAQRQQANEVVRPGGESLPGGVPEGSDEAYRTIATTTARIGELQQQLQAERNALGVTFPILLSKDYAPGALQNLPEGQLQQITGAWTGDVLDNIDKTRKAIADGTLKVWELRDVPELTWRSLGLPADGPLGQVLERYHQRERSQEQALQAAFAALAITAGIVATIATAGGAVVVAAAATGFGAGLGLAQLGQDVAKYRAETAAASVSLDPALAHISTNEPELLPIIMDLVATGMDLAAATAFVRSMSATERALAAEGRLVSISPQTRRLALSRPALLAEYERVANAKMPAMVADVLSKQGTTPNRARLVQLRQQFDVLRQSVGAGQLTAAQRQTANAILREARDLARADFNNVRDALWRRMRRDPDLLRIEQELQQAGDAASGGRALRVNTQTASGTQFEPLGVEHRTRLSDDPWRYNDPANLIVTDAPQNEQFMEALRQHGFVWPTNDIEDFVVRYGLNDQGLDFSPAGRP